MTGRRRRETVPSSPSSLEFRRLRLLPSCRKVARSTLLGVIFSMRASVKYTPFNLKSGNTVLSIPSFPCTLIDPSVRPSTSAGAVERFYRWNTRNGNVDGDSVVSQQQRLFFRALVGATARGASEWSEIEKWPTIGGNKSSRVIVFDLL